MEPALDRNLALSLAGFVLFVMANAFPVLTIELQGQVQRTTLLGTVTALQDAGAPWLALTVMLTCVVMPLLQLLGITWVILPFVLGGRPWKGALVLRMVRTFRSWSMLEVLMLGVLVTYAKLGKMGVIMIGPALYSLGALMVVLAGLNSGLDLGDLWERLGGRQEPLPPDQAHVTCHACHLVAPEGQHHCLRCGAALHRRKRDSLARTWALLVSAVILYIPANLLPVMRVTSLGKEQADTILSGVLFFLKEGSWYLALVIFFASIVVPLAKLATLAFLLVSIHRKSRWRPADRTRLYLLTELVGRWSMVDIYVVALMVALVELGSLATIVPGPGATAFAGVVVITLFAAESFDPRLIWDAMENPRERP